MPKYIYEGPVMEFGRCITDNWHGETFAPTKKKARSNLIFQFKVHNHRLPNTNISLPGTIKEG